MFPLASIDVPFWVQADYPTVNLTKEVEPIFEPLLMLMNFDALTQLSSEQFGAWDGITLENMTLTGTPDKKPEPKPEDSPHTGVSGKTMPILLLFGRARLADKAEKRGYFCGGRKLIRQYFFITKHC